MTKSIRTRLAGKVKPRNPLPARQALVSRQTSSPWRSKSNRTVIWSWQPPRAIQAALPKAQQAPKISVDLRVQQRWTSQCLPETRTTISVSPFFGPRFIRLRRWFLSLVTPGLPILVVLRRIFRVLILLVIRGEWPLGRRQGPWRLILGVFLVSFDTKHVSTRVFVWTQLTHLFWMQEAQRGGMKPCKNQTRFTEAVCTTYFVIIVTRTLLVHWTECQSKLMGFQDGTW